MLWLIKKIMKGGGRGGEGTRKHTTCQRARHDAKHTRDPLSSWWKSFTHFVGKKEKKYMTNNNKKSDEK